MISTGAGLAPAPEPPRQEDRPLDRHDRDEPLGDGVRARFFDAGFSGPHQPRRPKKRAQPTNQRRAPGNGGARTTTRTTAITNRTTTTTTTTTTTLNKENIERRPVKKRKAERLTYPSRGVTTTTVFEGPRISLEDCRLSKFQLSAEILVSLRLRRCGLTLEMLPEGNFVKLLDLDLSSNPLNRPGPSRGFHSLVTAPNLKSLDISDAVGSKTSLNLTTVQNFAMAVTTLDPQQWPSVLAALRYSRSVDLRDCVGLDAFMVELPNATEARIARTPCRGVHGPNLLNLDAGAIAFTAPALQSLEASQLYHQPSLTKLTLRCHVTATQLADLLPKLPKVIHLDIAETHHEDVVPSVATDLVRTHILPRTWSFLDLTKTFLSPHRDAVTTLWQTSKPSHRRVLSPPAGGFHLIEDKV